MYQLTNQMPEEILEGGNTVMRQNIEGMNNNKIFFFFYQTILRCPDLSWVTIPSVVALRSPVVVILPPARSPGEDVVSVAPSADGVSPRCVGGFAGVYAMAGGSSPLVSYARLPPSVRALPSLGVGVEIAPPPGGTFVGVKMKVAHVAEPCRSKIDHAPVDNTADGDSLPSVPSVADRASRGLGPVAIPLCKPLAFRVSIDTEKEIIHNSSVFESHGLICRF
ncbi:hypothetical protein SUGI_1201830 [Cryptomeria japonica]|nr:hypothetical protein SUGI_1201830 [Cryptomeria japonica]